jgi:peptidylprolyl isomerase
MTRRALIALLLAGSLGTGLIACGSDDEAPSGDTSTTITGPQRSVGDVDVSDPTNVKEKPSVAVPDGKPPKKLEQKDLVPGTGAAAKTGDKITVNYVGLSWSTGQEFDASWDRGDTIDVTLGAGSVIPGWDTGLVGVKEGTRRVLVIPPSQAYGAQGSPPAIAANETLVFVVDVKKVTPKA